MGRDLKKIFVGLLFMSSVYVMADSLICQTTEDYPQDKFSGSGTFTQPITYDDSNGSIEYSHGQHRAVIETSKLNSQAPIVTWRIFEKEQQVFSSDLALGEFTKYSDQFTDAEFTIVCTVE